MSKPSELVIETYNHWVVTLHKNQCYIGRVIIWSKRQDATDLMMVTPDELKELIMIGRKVKNLLEVFFGADMFNYASLGNRCRNLHLHIIPRYKKPVIFNGRYFYDKRWGLNYAPYNYEFTLDKEILFNIRDAIKGYLKQNTTDLEW